MARLWLEAVGVAPPCTTTNADWMTLKNLQSEMYLYMMFSLGSMECMYCASDKMK